MNSLPLLFGSLISQVLAGLSANQIGKGLARCEGRHLRYGPGAKEYLDE
jgi:hypothetical protein